MQESKPILIVGLGNPGAEYIHTRHNVGFMAAGFLAGADAKWKNEHNAKTTRTEIDGHRAIIACPQTFMNNSGVAVLALSQFYKIPIENIIVIHDDMDLPIGDIRQKVGGSSAGHNGIKSIDANIGREYRRIRIGIGHPRDMGMQINPVDWVLGKFGDDELTKIQNAIKTIVI